MRWTASASPKGGGSPKYSESGERRGLTRRAISGSLDTATLDDVMSMHANHDCRNHLVEIDADGNPIPELAESWEATADVAQWVFILHKGVVSHTGKSLDAQYVIYSINHHCGVDSKSIAKGIVEQIKEIKADGKHRVIFTLAGGSADFPYLLNDYHLTIVPAGMKGNDWEKGNGTGGYILQKWEPGVRAFFTRNPNYWKAGRAHFDEIEMIQVPDVNARTNA